MCECSMDMNAHKQPFHTKTQADFKKEGIKDDNFHFHYISKSNLSAYSDLSGHVESGKSDNVQHERIFLI